MFPNLTKTLMLNFSRTVLKVSLANFAGYSLARTILQGTVKGGRRQGGQRKRWEDNIEEWTGLEFGKSQRAVENREKWRKLVAKIICGAPTTLAVKGLMMMMMMSLA